MTKTSKEILDKINSPKDLKKLDLNALVLLTEELRQETIEIVSQTGGHLGAGLGVIELTIALHYVFDTPRDKLVWDIGHQAYPHKILTQRREKMLTLRKADGISGFTKRSESEYDTFIGGHGGTAISSALGMAKARDLNKDNFEVISVIGDGSMTAGMAYEAMNNIKCLDNRLILVLNDNKMSIAPAVGSLTTYLTKLISSKPYLSFRENSKKLLNYLPPTIKKILKKFERNTKDLINNGNFFEEMGFYYLGPIDGHNLEDLIILLSNIKNDHSLKKPILLHIITEKGKGFISKDCQDEEKFHAVSKFDVNTKIQQKSSTVTNTEIFANTLINLANEDKSIVAITAAMPSGTGLDKFVKFHPDRMYDVGMAEQHSVTFAAGLACERIKPYVALYSTFLQRAYDQVINDVALQCLPVRFIIDRAGYVGADGPTHAGSFDLAYLSALPNFIIMCPSHKVDLEQMIEFSTTINNFPSAIRFPRGEVIELSIPPLPIEMGKGRLIHKGEDIVLISIGTRLSCAIKAAEKLKESHNIEISIIDARFAKPLDHNLIIWAAKNHKALITIEEGCIGGFASHVQNSIQNSLDTTPPILVNLFYPDIFLDQDTQENMHDISNMSIDKIYNIILEVSERIK